MSAYMYRCPKCGKSAVHLNYGVGVWQCEACGQRWPADDPFEVTQLHDLRAKLEALATFVDNQLEQIAHYHTNIGWDDGVEGEENAYNEVLKRLRALLEAVDD